MSIAGQIELGSVVSLWRYPVKSMVGEELNATEVTERGLLGDRSYALVDSSDGKVATAKNPRNPGWHHRRHRPAVSSQHRGAAELGREGLCGEPLGWPHARPRDDGAPEGHRPLRALCDDHSGAGG